MTYLHKIEKLEIFTYKILKITKNSIWMPFGSVNGQILQKRQNRLPKLATRGPHSRDQAWAHKIQKLGNLKMSNFDFLPKFARTTRKATNRIYAEFRILRKVGTAQRRRLWHAQVWMDFEYFFSSS